MTQNTLVLMLLPALVVCYLALWIGVLLKERRAARLAIALLCQDMAEWGSWEDGIPEEMWTDYRAGLDIVGADGVRTALTGRRLHAERQRLSDIACMEAIAALGDRATGVPADAGGEGEQ